MTNADIQHSPRSTSSWSGPFVPCNEYYVCIKEDGKWTEFTTRAPLIKLSKQSALIDKLNDPEAILIYEEISREEVECVIVLPRLMGPPLQYQVALSCVCNELLEVSDGRWRHLLIEKNGVPRDWISSTHIVDELLNLIERPQQAVGLQDLPNLHRLIANMLRNVILLMKFLPYSVHALAKKCSIDEYQLKKYLSWLHGNQFIILQNEGIFLTQAFFQTFTPLSDKRLLTHLKKFQDIEASPLMDSYLSAIAAYPPKMHEAQLDRLKRLISNSNMRFTAPSEVSIRINVINVLLRLE